MLNMKKLKFIHHNFLNKTIIMENKSLSELFNFKTTKQTNGEVNKLRECRFVQEINCGNSSDSIIANLKNQFNKYDITIKKCVQKGGCQNSHDFEIECEQNNNIIKFNVELKVSSTGKLAQLSDVYIKNNNSIFTNEFTSFINGWYEILKGIKKTFKLETELKKDDIRQYICKVPKKDYQNSEFIEELKDIIKSSSNKRTQLNNITKEYISNFLADNFNSHSKEAILDLYKSKLNCKDFIIIYKQTGQKLILVKNEPTDISITKVELLKAGEGTLNVGLKVYFKFTDKNKNEETKLTTIRLRFKNGTGLYGVAWQLGYFK